MKALFRTIAKSISASAIAAFAAVINQTAMAEKITFLSWNHPDYANSYKKIVAEFEAAHPGVTVNWLDRKGSEFNAFLQTQIIGGETPDLVEFQAMLWREFQDQGLVLDLTPFLAKEPDVKNAFEPAIQGYWTFDNRVWALPALWDKSIVYYNMPALNAAGLRAPPRDWHELLAYIAKTTDPAKQQAGFLTLNYDWSYWPIFAMNGVEFLNPAMTKAAFNSPKMREVLRSLAEATKRSEISKTSWTGRWLEPNAEFSAGRAAIYLSQMGAYTTFSATGKWISPETLGIGHWPGGWSVPAPQGWSIMKATKHAGLAWDLAKLLTSRKWSGDTGRVLMTLTGNKQADLDTVAYFKTTDSLAARILLDNVGDKFVPTGVWKTPQYAALTDAFWPEIQSILLGQKSIDTGLASAEEAVNHVLEQ